MDPDELVSSFCAVANCDSERAKFFLGAANWELETAMNAFFLDPEGIGGEIPEIEEIIPSQPAHSQPQTLREIASERPSPPREQSRFGTIASLNAGDDDSSDDDTNKHYAGGSEHSGQLIKGNSDRLKVKDVFKSAREHGAEDVEDHGTQTRRQNLPVFGGGGFKLGNDAGSSQAVPAAAGASRPPPEQRSTITFWKGGFTVDDGSLRKMEDPANKEFLSAVMKGEIPQELVRQARGAEVHVNMVDKRTEEYVPPRAVLRPFSGSGFKLGSPVPQILSTPTSSLTPTNPPTSPTVSIDHSAAITSIQLRLSDGTRLVSKFNHSHTIADIRHFINLSRPGAATEYTLMTTFPNKVLEEEEQTIADAGLLNACIVQRKC